MIGVHRAPSRRDVRVFGALCLLFFGGLGAVVLWRPAGLVGAAAVLGGAWLISLAFNRENRTEQLIGVFLPALFAAAGGSVRLGTDPWLVASALWGTGAVAALVTWSAPGAGRVLYVGWMLAAVPVGWTLTRLVLAAVYYLVLTPIGLIMRIAGRDPLRRRFDPGAASYWIERRSRPDPARYFKQF
jgi:hypothetical protein